jgi:enoyl-CoA hydratase
MSATTGIERLPISTAHCDVDQDGHVVIVTLNRPAVKNALSTEMLVGMADAFAYIDAEPQVRVGILTGADGEFCAGADLKALSATAQHSQDERVLRRAGEIGNFHWKGLLREARPGKPLVCAVEGHAVAGGTELLLGTDIRIAGQSATLGLFESRRALFPMGGSAIRLPRQIPYTHAMDILLTGRPVTAAEALAMGLITRVVPDGSALSVAREVADQIAACGPLSVQAILRCYRETEGMAEEEALKISDAIGWPVIASEDAKEGTRAFAEKRPAVFHGR